MFALKLYTTSGCHLCEKAEIFLDYLQSQKLCHWQAVEIADDDALLEQYGVRIPVIGREGETDELGWPFDIEQIQQWLLQGVAAE